MYTEEEEEYFEKNREKGKKARANYKEKQANFATLYLDEYGKIRSSKREEVNLLTQAELHNFGMARVYWETGNEISDEDYTNRKETVEIIKIGTAGARRYRQGDTVKRTPGKPRWTPATDKEYRKNYFQKEYQEKNKEKQRSYHQQYYKKNREKLLQANLLYREKVKKRKLDELQQAQSAATEEPRQKKQKRHENTLSDALLKKLSYPIKKDYFYIKKSVAIALQRALPKNLREDLEINKLGIKSIRKIKGESNRYRVYVFDRDKYNDFCKPYHPTQELLSEEELVPGLTNEYQEVLEAPNQETIHEKSSKVVDQQYADERINLINGTESRASQLEIDTSEPQKTQEEELGLSEPSDTIARLEIIHENPVLDIDGEQLILEQQTENHTAIRQQLPDLVAESLQQRLNEQEIHLNIQAIQQEQDERRLVQQQRNFTAEMEQREQAFEQLRTVKTLELEGLQEQLNAQRADLEAQTISQEQAKQYLTSWELRLAQQQRDFTAEIEQREQTFEQLGTAKTLELEGLQEKLNAQKESLEAQFLLQVEAMKRVTSWEQRLAQQQRNFNEMEQREQAFEQFRIAKTLELQGLQEKLNAQKSGLEVQAFQQEQAKQNLISWEQKLAQQQRDFTDEMEQQNRAGIEFEQRKQVVEQNLAAKPLQYEQLKRQMVNDITIREQVLAYKEQQLLTKQQQAEAEFQAQVKLKEQEFKEREQVLAYREQQLLTQQQQAEAEFQVQVKLKEQEFKERQAALESQLNYQPSPTENFPLEESNQEKLNPAPIPDLNLGEDLLSCEEHFLQSETLDGYPQYGFFGRMISDCLEESMPNPFLLP